ncbi:hypothetical protein ACN27E_23145 [Mycobacterium sp. WMMD1722]|uniref:hypothetical protein n=1 Tax=Mycobacterium sp. WMMD1722 TaxID=3404117 RepID=UPI003BF4B641
MADTARIGFASAKKLGTTVIGALAVSGALLSFGAGTAFADEISADPSDPRSRPAVEDGVRTSGSAESAAIQGEARASAIAVPNITAGSPQPGNLSDLGINCLFDWDNSCGPVTTPPY